MSINQRCDNAGPLGKLIPTRSFAAYIFARLSGRVMSRFRW